VVKKNNQFFFCYIGHVYGIDYMATVIFANQSANSGAVTAGFTCGNIKCKEKNISQFAY